MKKISLLGLLCLVVWSAFAQSRNHVTVSGRIVEEDTNEPAVQANVQLLRLPDSTNVAGVASDTEGFYTFSKITSGKYLLKVSYMGFKNQVLSLSIPTSSTTYRVKTIKLKVDAILMKEMVVTAEAPQVQVVEDTLIFNSSAYRTPDGAMLEELVKKFPGAEVDNDGNIKINGKQVRKIMLNGKEFFGGDVKTGMKNLPVEMIDKVKTYDKKSDLARITGIDDGEEETVLDLTVKKGMNQGIFGNIDLAAGTEDRYSGRGMVNYFRERTQVSVTGEANNVNGRGMSRGGGGGGNGLNATKMIGASFAKDMDKLEMGGSFRYNYRDGDAITSGYSESFLLDNSSFSNSNSFSGSRSEGFQADFRLEWRPDEKTNVIFRPNFSYNESNSSSRSQSGTFNADPFLYVDNPNDYLNLDELTDAEMDPMHDIRLNASNNASVSESKSLSAGATLQLNRKLNDEGRNITFQGRVSYSDNDNDSYSEAFTRYYREQRMDTIFRYNISPGKNYTYSGRFTYSEPITHTTFLQFSYQLQYSYRENDRRTYSLLDATGGNTWRLYQPLPSDYMDYEDKQQSKYAEYKTFDHNINVSLRFIREKYQLSAGFTVLPQQTELSYRKNQLDTVVKRKILNFSPNVNLRIRFSRMSNLQFTYRGNTSQPGIESLLPVEDNANPLNIQIGNPGLKPSFSHNMNFNFNDYKVETQRNIMANASFSVTQNSITNIRTYNEETGGWINTSDNINGNWNARVGFGYNTALRNKKFNVETNTNFGYTNHVGYLTVGKETKKNTSVDMNLNERLRASYRNDWLQISLDGNLSYSWEKDKLRPDNEQQPYTYSYGGEMQVNALWNMTLTTNVFNQCRRGYTDASMNRDELIWNAQLSQRLSRSASLSFEMYDILRNQSNITRRLTANGRSVYQYNGVNSYCMVHFIYRLNIFGGKDARRGMRNREGFRGGRGGPGGGFGGPGGGGFPMRGGGRPF